MNLRRWKILTFGVLTGLILFSLYLFLKGQYKNFHSSIDTDKFSNYGTFIGGLFGSLSIYLLLLTYFYSLQSNELTKIETFYQDLNSEINDASFDGKKGVDAYLTYSMQTKVKNVILDNLNVVVTSFATYLKYINDNKLISDADKKTYTTRLYLIYYSKVLWPLHETILENGVIFIIKEMHDDSKLILPKYADLGIKCINYLRNENIAAASEFKKEKISKLEEIIASAQQQHSL
jgi:hypothetical protein